MGPSTTVAPTSYTQDGITLYVWEWAAYWDEEEINEGEYNFAAMVGTHDTPHPLIDVGVYELRAQSVLRVCGNVPRGRSLLIAAVQHALITDPAFQIYPSLAQSRILQPLTMRKRRAKVGTRKEASK